MRVNKRLVVKANVYFMSILATKCKLCPFTGQSSKHEKHKDVCPQEPCVSFDSVRLCEQIGKHNCIYQKMAAELFRVRAKLAGSVQAANKARAAAEDTALLIL